MQQPVEVQVDEHEPIVERVAAIDVAKASGMVCLRIPHETIPDRRVTKVWPVAATTAALVELGDHLRCERVTRVVLESTSDYWRPFYYLLEAAGLMVWLVNAAQVKNVPGRPKTDKIDAVWLAKLAERSMLSPSLVPAEPMRHVRDLARARFDLVEDRTRVKQRIEKLLEDALIKISSVLTDVLGVSGRAMIETLIAGQRSPKVLAELAHGRARTRRADLEQALHGRFTDHHAQLARMLLGQLDELTARITHVTDTARRRDQRAAGAHPATRPTGADERDQAQAQPPQAGYNSAVARLCAVPGGGPDSVRAVLGEAGSRGALLRRGPLRTVRAHSSTHTAQASPEGVAGAMLASCVCGLGGSRWQEACMRRVRSPSGVPFPSGGRGSRRRSPCGRRSATTFPLRGGLGSWSA